MGFVSFLHVAMRGRHTVAVIHRRPFWGRCRRLGVDSSSPPHGCPRRHRSPELGTDTNSVGHWSRAFFDLVLGGASPIDWFAAGAAIQAHGTGL
jgi:hypothetical protein